MKTIKRNLVTSALDGEVDILVHGCNCFCTMGAGIARAIKQTFPEAYEADKRTGRGNRRKLGTYTQATEKGVTIVNAYTQYRYGPAREKHVDYRAIRKCFAEISKEFAGKRIGIPKIGCGLAGGDWKKVEGIISDALKDEDVTVYYI